MSRTSPLAHDTPGRCLDCGQPIDPGHGFCAPCDDARARDYYRRFPQAKAAVAKKSEAQRIAALPQAGPF